MEKIQNFKCMNDLINVYHEFNQVVKYVQKKKSVFYKVKMITVSTGITVQLPFKIITP